MKESNLYQGFPYPKTNLEEVLLTLITQGHTSFFDFAYMQGYRTRVSNLVLKHGLKLKTVIGNRCNKFGRNYSYSIHKLPEEEKQFAIELYNELNSK